MRNVVKLMISGLLLVLLGACAAPSENKPAGNSNTNANTKAANSGAAPAATAPSADVLAAIEKKSWEDWAKRDKAGVEGFLAAKFVSVGNSGASDRAESVKGWTEHKCEMSELTFSDQKVTDLGDGFYLFTYKATVSAKCDGKQNPSPLNASTVYTKEGEAWKAVYYQEVPTPDAKGEYAPPSTPVDKTKELASLAAAPEDIVTVEKKLWETWKSQDSKAFEEHLSAKFVGNGRAGFADRATYLKNAFDPPCKVESATPGPMKALELSKDLTLIVYRAAQKGTCGKDALPANVMSVSIYRRENGKPMAMYYMENPVK